MLVVMKTGAKPAEIEAVVRVIEEMGYEARPMPGAQRTAVGLVGNDGRVDSSRIEALSGVAQVIHVTQPYKQVSREWKAENTIVTIGGTVHVGGTEVPIIAGPCSVESEEQIVTAARTVRAAGAAALRGGAFKPRSSPYSFQGLGKKGLELLALARRETGLADRHRSDGRRGRGAGGRVRRLHPDRRAQHAELFAAPCRAARCNKPVLLKRGLAATIQELAAERGVRAREGNPTGDPLRARRAHLRQRGAQHVRPHRDPDRAAAVAPADHRRSEPRHGSPRQGDPDGARGGRRGRRTA